MCLPSEGADDVAYPRLHGMYVRPDYRGRRLGSKRLHQVLSLARPMPGLEEIQLAVAAHSTRVIALYERWGFERVWAARPKPRGPLCGRASQVLDLARTRGDVIAPAEAP